MEDKMEQSKSILLYLFISKGRKTGFQILPNCLVTAQGGVGLYYNFLKWDH